MEVQAAVPNGEPPAIKGLHFVGQTKAIKALASAEAFKALVENLPPATRALVDEPPLAADWLLMEHRRNLHRFALEHCFGGKVAKFYEVGELTAKHTTKLAYRAFIKFMSPEQVAKRASTLWLLITRNNGTLTFREAGPKTLELRYAGLFLTNAEYWEFVRGNLAYFLQSTSVTDPQVVLVDGGGEKPDATYRITWR